MVSSLTRVKRFYGSISEIMIKHNEEEIWTWYQHIEDWKASGLPQKRFSEQNGLSYIKFCNMVFRIIYKSKSDPKLYATLVKHGRAYLESGTKLSSKYAKEHGVRPVHLGEIITHLNYLDAIGRMKLEKESQMNFIQIPHAKAVTLPAILPEPELIEKQNDLEIMIAKGVRVIIAPNIEPMKVIKIIELLKDL